VGNRPGVRALLRWLEVWAGKRRAPRLTAKVRSLASQPLLPLGTHGMAQITHGEGVSAAAAACALNPGVHRPPSPPFPSSLAGKDKLRLQRERERKAKLTRWRWEHGESDEEDEEAEGLPSVFVIHGPTRYEHGPAPTHTPPPQAVTL